MDNIRRQAHVIEQRDELVSDRFTVLGGEIIFFKEFFHLPSHRPGRRLPFMFEDLIDQIIGNDQPQGRGHEPDADKTMQSKTGGETLIRERSAERYIAQFHENPSRAC